MPKKSESKPEHTPLPWHKQQDADVYTHIIRGPNEELIAQFPQTTAPVTLANIELAVRACNSHAQLREALEAALRRGCGCGQTRTWGKGTLEGFHVPRCFVPLAEAALRAAKGGE